jgi:hypothetical protein
MAITASIALGDSSASPGQRVGVVLTVSNSGGSAVTVTAVTPMMSPSGSTKESVAGNSGTVPLGPGMTVSVAASGSTTFAYQVVAFAPQPGGLLANPASYVYDIGATVYTSDGAITDATSAELTVTAPTH